MSVSSLKVSKQFTILVFVTNFQEQKLSWSMTLVYKNQSLINFYKRYWHTTIITTNKTIKQLITIIIVTIINCYYCFV